MGKGNFTRGKGSRITPGRPMSVTHKTKSVYADLKNRPNVTNQRKKIDWQRVWRYAHDQCTIAEIATHLGISEPTLRQYDEFFRIYKKGYAAGNMSLRRKMFRRAMAGSDKILQWLSINRLGMKDAIQISGDPLNPLEVSTVDLSRLSVEELQLMEQKTIEIEKILTKAQIPAGEQTIDVQVEDIMPQSQQALLPEPVTVPKSNGRANGRIKRSAV